MFLDEIGDLDPAIQVKLLRVIQTRRFQRLGETEGRPFRGKVIAATNRDLAAAMAAGRFREDLYYRLCSDLIRTPTLAEQLEQAPEDLANLVRHIARRLVGREAEALAEEALVWIRRELGPSYPWPGNIRELEQCVRNVLVRGEYRPARAAGENARAVARAADRGGLAQRRRAAHALLHDRLPDERQLRGRRAPAGPRPADGEGPRRRRIRASGTSRDATGQRS